MKYSKVIRCHMCDKLGLMHVHRLLEVRQVPVDILVKAEDVGSQLNSIRFKNID